MRCRSIFYSPMILKFERGALIAVAGLIAGLFLLVLLSPLDRETSSPKASLRLAVSQPVPENTVFRDSVPGLLRLAIM